MLQPVAPVQPEIVPLKQLDDDRKVLPATRRRNDQKDKPMFIDVATFGAQADACAKYLTKGRAIAVTGRLVYHEWDDNGTRRSKHHIIGRVQFGGTRDITVKVASGEIRTKAELKDQEDFIPWKRGVSL